LESEFFLKLGETGLIPCYYGVFVLFVVLGIELRAQPEEGSFWSY
jgi:hypothetical protein